MNLKPKEIAEGFIFGSRWLLVPFYIGLAVVQVFYCMKFCENLWHLCKTFGAMNEMNMMMSVLTLIDITMVANLLKMIVVGSYQTFVEKIANDHSEKVSSGALKVKMGGSLVGVSSIHLLQSFIDPAKETTYEIVVKCSIHLIFLVSTVGLAYIEYLHDLKMEVIHE